MKKRVLSLALALVLLLALSACGGKTEEPVVPKPEVLDPTPESTLPEDVDEPTEPEEPTEPDELDGTKTMKYYSEFIDGGAYTTEMRTEFEGITSTTLSVYDGDNFYSESDANGMKSIVILIDGFYYILDPATKTGFKMSGEMMQDAEQMFSDSLDSYLTALSTGDIDIDGKSYYYEEFSLEEVKAKYCFDGDELKYILTDIDGQVYTVEILRMEKGADKSLFAVPSDYTMTEY